MTAIPERRINMAQAKRLRVGTDCPPLSLHEEEERVAVLRATVETYLADFGRAVEKAATTGAGEESMMIVDQDSCAAGYDGDEYTLLGMAIKFAGLRGVAVTVIGRNRHSFKKK
jgi:hypothetical protein